jgi:hypothetical protein
MEGIQVCTRSSKGRLIVLCGQGAHCLLPFSSGGVMNPAQLFSPNLFDYTAIAMFSIASSLLLIEGAWKAYKFIKSAVGGVPMTNDSGDSWLIGTSEEPGISETERLSRFESEMLAQWEEHGSDDGLTDEDYAYMRASQAQDEHHERTGVWLPIDNFTDND